MNLALTPLSEAYNVPKLKHKTKVNSHTNVDTQKKLLQDAAQNIHENEPNGYSMHAQSYDLLTNNNKNNESPKTLNLTITDPELIDMLSIYKDDYISTLFKKVMRKNENVETFVNMNKESVDTNVVLAIIVFLLIADIILRLKYRR